MRAQLTLSHGFFAPADPRKRSDTTGTDDSSAGLGRSIDGKALQPPQPHFKRLHILYVVSDVLITLQRQNRAAQEPIEAGGVDTLKGHLPPLTALATFRGDEEYVKTYSAVLSLLNVWSTERLLPEADLVRIYAAANSADDDHLSWEDFQARIAAESADAVGIPARGAGVATLNLPKRHGVLNDPTAPWHELPAANGLYMKQTRGYPLKASAMPMGGYELEAADDQLDPDLRLDVQWLHREMLHAFDKFTDPEEVQDIDALGNIIFRDPDRPTRNYWGWSLDGVSKMKEMSRYHQDRASGYDDLGNGRLSDPMDQVNAAVDRARSLAAERAGGMRGRGGGHGGRGWRGGRQGKDIICALGELIELRPPWRVGGSFAPADPRKRIDLTGAGDDRDAGLGRSIDGKVQQPPQPHFKRLHILYVVSDVLITLQRQNRAAQEPIEAGGVDTLKAHLPALAALATFRGGEEYVKTYPAVLSLLNVWSTETLLPEADLVRIYAAANSADDDHLSWEDFQARIGAESADALGMPARGAGIATLTLPKRHGVLNDPTAPWHELPAANGLYMKQTRGYPLKASAMPMGGYELEAADDQLDPDLSLDVQWLHREMLHAFDKFTDPEEVQDIDVLGNIIFKDPDRPTRNYWGWSLDGVSKMKEMSRYHQDRASGYDDLGNGRLSDPMDQVNAAVDRARSLAAERAGSMRGRVVQELRTSDNLFDGRPSICEPAPLGLSTQIIVQAPNTGPYLAVTVDEQHRRRSVQEDLHAGMSLSNRSLAWPWKHTDLKYHMSSPTKRQGPKGPIYAIGNGH
ncbi:hypothetical protein B0A55_00402 [Friedmanniomyces simplex]|uniref:CID domain-containing protein n=1 Tax=Friedmanniomyces simplex TaxID=329884 RepID=A0A4U0XZX5_9PEZI|nr:hypothetical protein B0A55_00402 [Friedmanniomyces simplex]